VTSDQIVKSIQAGQVGVVPTDTVYGLACSALNKTAVAKLYGLKKRSNKPGTIIASSIDQLIELGIKKRYLKAVEAYWPNSISIVMPCGKELSYLHLGKFSLAVRIPKMTSQIQFIEKAGPLLTSSANQPGKPESINIHQAKKYFGEQVDFYVDVGNLGGRLPSTVIEVVDDVVSVLRQGSVKINENGSISNDT
jgi:L-threonylcarbamoyladenylate synthase